MLTPAIVLMMMRSVRSVQITRTLAQLWLPAPDDDMEALAVVVVRETIGLEVD